MRIGYVFSRPLPSPDADTQQVMKTLDALAGEGADVELLVAQGGVRKHGGSEAFEAELQRFYSLNTRPRLACVPGPAPTRLGAERVLHAVSSALFAGGRNYDVIHTRNRSVAVLCALRGMHVVFETYRKLGDEAPALVRVFSGLARSGSLLGIVSHSDLAADSIAAAGFPRARIAAIHNGYEPRDLLPRLTRAQARSELGLDPQRALVCYTGDLRARKGIATLLEIAALTPEVAYLLAGGRAEDGARIAAECRARGMSNVECRPFRPIAEVAPLMYAADVLIIPPSSAPLERIGRTVLPLKLFMYLAAGRAIVAPAARDVGELLQHGVNALMVPPDDPQAGAAAVRKLASDPELAARLAEQALVTAAGLTWRARAAKLLACIAKWRTAELAEP